MAKRCPYCKSTKITLNPERLWVCAECGTVVKPLFVRPKLPKTRPLQRPN